VIRPERRRGAEKRLELQTANRQLQTVNLAAVPYDNTLFLLSTWYHRYEILGGRKGVSRRNSPVQPAERI
jgi:hypothetical protein